jgi:hypothetical protein
MALHEIRSVEDLLRSTRGHRGDAPAGSTAWLYRGQCVAGQALIASAGRLCHISGPADHDLRMFHEWRQRASFYERAIPQNDWEALAVAAHHGLATRLLDWSLNPLVALFFCVIDAQANEPMGDGVLYAFAVRRVIDAERARLGEIDEVAVFFPAGHTHRVIRQRGAFTYHPDPRRRLEDQAGHDQLFGWLVPRNAKLGLRDELDKLGINLEMLFPDLEGFSNHLNWISDTARGGAAQRDLHPDHHDVNTIRPMDAEHERHFDVRSAGRS